MEARQTEAALFLYRKAHAKFHFSPNKKLARAPFSFQTRPPSGIHRVGLHLFILSMRRNFPRKTRRKETKTRTSLHFNGTHRADANLRKRKGISRGLRAVSCSLSASHTRESPRRPSCHVHTSAAVRRRSDFVIFFQCQKWGGIPVFSQPFQPGNAGGNVRAFHLYFNKKTRDRLKNKNRDVCM